MAATVGDIYRVIDEFAPFITQEEWDNAGLLAGHPARKVETVLVALDVTPGVIEEALRLGADLVVTHHPILFHARKNLREDDPEGALLCKIARAELSLIAAHTNFDAAEGGVNDVLAELIGLSEVEALDHGLRMGHFGGTLNELSEAVRASLGGVIRPYENGYRRLERVAVCGGAGGSLWKTAFDAGADGYVTGEVRHDEALMASQWGLAMIEAGHLGTERPAIKVLAATLQNRLDALQYNVMVYESNVMPF